MYFDFEIYMYFYAFASRYVHIQVYNLDLGSQVTSRQRKIQKLVAHSKKIGCWQRHM